MFLKKKTEFSSVPRHIAFIMDGNRRWAVQRGLNKMIGHKQGAQAMKNIVEVLTTIPGVKYASFFAFSTENWKRDRKELDYLFSLVDSFLRENDREFDDRNVKIVAMGDVTRFPQNLQDALAQAIEKTKNNTGLVVNLALNYGGRADIVHAVNKFLENGSVAQSGAFAKISEADISANLYSAPAPDVDFLIRTSGEQRVSNFMLWQLAYAEMYFSKTFWPDFDEKELFKALNEFSKRNRRFGGK